MTSGYPDAGATLKAHERGRSRIRKIGEGGVMGDTPETLKAAANALFKGARLSVFHVALPDPNFGRDAIVVFLLSDADLFPPPRS